MTSFDVLCGRRPPNIIRFLPGETTVAAVSQALIDRDEVLRQLKFNVERSQQHMMKYANKKRRDVSFQEGDLMLLKLRPQRQNSVCPRVFQKLSAYYYGPFKLMHKV